MGRKYIFNQRKINIKKYFKQRKECEQFTDWKNSILNKCAPFEKSSFLANSSKFHSKTEHKPNEYCEMIREPHNLVYGKPTFTMNGLPTSIIDNKNDLQSSENILHEWKDIHCNMIESSKTLRSQIFRDELLEKVSSRYYLFTYSFIL